MFCFLAKIALEELGLEVGAYYASESDNDAIEISKANHKNTIVYIESMENLTIEKVIPRRRNIHSNVNTFSLLKIISISPIDLVLGSSPPEYSSTGSGRKSLIGLSFLLCDYCLF